MATKTIAWGTGSGNITLTYEGQGSGSVSVESDANNLYEERVKSITIKTSAGSPTVTKTVTIKQQGKSLGWTTKDFDFTGGVQSIELPAGKYKLQCWGAQGGTSYGSSSGAGSKGGYSEGVLTLTETTTLYVFVGGKGANGSSTSLVNGGWNGGGASVGYSSYNSSGENGYSYPACGGGATDICTVTSSMNYSSGRTNRSSASLLSRIIVAGGGAGGSYYKKEVTTTTTVTNDEFIPRSLANPLKSSGDYANDQTYFYFSEPSDLLTLYSPGETIYLYLDNLPSEFITISFPYKATDGRTKYCNLSRNYTSFKIPSDYVSPQTVTVSFYGDVRNTLYDYNWLMENVQVYRKVIESTTSTSTSSGYSNQSQQGGGTSGRGQFPGTQSNAGSGSQSGGFGYGANQTVTNYRYCSGGAGGGWYGGGTHRSDSSTSYIDYTGGGSGFVNIAANSSYRPSGYTGLQLDSGSTTAGNTSHPSISGGTETGHSGNGYAKITVL